jgi:ribulose-phosphate 3-epimerase
MIEISASLLAANHAVLGEEVCRAASAGVDSFHFDLMDGHYVPNLAFSPQHLRALREYTKLPFCLHLELSDPLTILNAIPPETADVVIFQWDTVDNPHSLFTKARECGLKIGLSLNPQDNPDCVQRLLPELDQILVLGVVPGFGGQTMLPGTTEKIAVLSQMLSAENKQISLAVDGGVNSSNASSLTRAGADCLIMGTALFGADDMRAVVSTIKGLSGS